MFKFLFVMMPAALVVDIFFNGYPNTRESILLMLIGGLVVLGTMREVNGKS